MLKHLTCLVALTLSTQLLALRATNLTTLCDEKEDIWAVNLLMNEKKDAALIWTTSEGSKEHLEISFKTEAGWSLPQRLPSIANNFFNSQAEIDAEGNVTLAWDLKGPDYTTFHYVTHKKAGEETFGEIAELGQMLDNPKEADYQHYDTSFVGEGNLCFVEAEDSKGITGLIYLPKEKITHKFTLSKEASLQREFSYFDSISAHAESNNLPYLVWEVRSYGHDARTQLWGCSTSSLEPEKICAFKLDYMFTKPEVTTGPKGEVAVAWEEVAHAHDQNLVRVVLKTEQGWGEVVDLSSPAENAEDLKICFDAKGNLMAVWSVQIDDMHFIKAAYKPQGGPWSEPISFQSPQGLYRFPQIQTDNQDHFVLIWQEELRNRQSILGTTFSTKEEIWSSPTRLSAEEQSAWDARFHFTSDAKALIAWTTTPNGFEEVIQVGELHID